MAKKLNREARLRRRLRGIMRGAYVKFDGNAEGRQKAYKRMGNVMTSDELDVFMGLKWRWRIYVDFTWSCGHTFEIEFDTTTLYELNDLKGVLDELQADNAPNGSEFIMRTWRATIIH